MTEPDAGTNTLAVRTTARQTSDSGGGYLLSGRKVWTSRLNHTDLVVVLARTDGDPKAESDESHGADRTAGLTLFLVDVRKAVAQTGAGAAVPFSMTPIRAEINHSSFEVVFDNL